MGDSLATNVILCHLDISHNNFDYDQCSVISEYLNSNHAILGIHIIGNDAFVDSLGFLVPTHTTKQPYISHLTPRMLNSSKKKRKG
mmetsp:Transcript_16381/g.7801  ORF Transcript_16381/g.7801 Transcript_16381/m.7801 type:complete len:86 (-) Transcript_16381:834-1091(-)